MNKLEVLIQPSKKKGKKYDAAVNGKTVSFGAKGYSDYTIHKDPERKKRYETRHKKNENWSDPTTAGFYAKHLLWNKTSLQASIADVNKRMKNVNIKMKKMNNLFTVLIFLMI